MKKVFLVFLVLAGLLTVVSACGQPQPPDKSPPQEKGSFRVEVSRRGFNNTPGEFRLEVEQGQEVEITFVYADLDFSQNNPHVIAIPAFGITTRILDENNPEDTVRFTASTTGEIVFKCIETACVGHTNLKGGIIVIQPRG